MGRYQGVLPILEKEFKRATDPALKRASGLRLTHTYTDLGQDDKAVEVALELTRFYPQDPEVLCHAGRLFANYAYLATVKLAEVAPDSFWLRLAAGEANESQERFEAAIREYKEVTVAPAHSSRSSLPHRAGAARAREAVDRRHGF